ncbi:PAS domain S-box protein [Aliinostoc sp. HNIBRCY26]|uniref:PAS domain S-box protein n=1 Tax=Aliinostoc sp. HNIBRCY26 TaxID=3418997 RepID=UPI003D048F0A
MTTDELTMQFDEQLIDLTHLYHALNRYPLTIKPHDSLVDAISMMYPTRAKELPSNNLHPVCKSRNRYLLNNSCVLVVEAQKVLGILTEQDIVRLTASRIDFSQVTVNQVMTQPVITMKLSDLQDVMKVFSLMHQHQVRHLPIVDDEERLIGIVTATSLLEVLHQLPLVGIVEALQQSSPALDYPITKPKNSSTEITELYNSLELWQKDFSDCRIVQQTIRQSETLYRQLIEGQSDVILRVDLSARIKFANHAACEIFGRQLADFVDLSIFDLFPPHELSQARQNFINLQSPPYGLTLQEQAVITVKGMRWFEWKITGIQNELGEVIQFQGVGRDITERKLMEEALRASEEKFRYFAENTHALFWMADIGSGENLYVNPAYEKIWGRSCESLRQNPSSWLDSLHPEDRDRVLDKIERQKRGEPTNEEYRILRPDGTVRWIWDRGFPICNAQGTIYTYGGVAEDITERKKTEDSLRQSEERLSLALKSAGMGIFDWNLLTNATLWSANMGLLYGLPQDTICPNPEEFLNLLHPEDRLPFREAVHNSIKHRQEFISEYRVIWPDGSIHWLSSKGHTYCNETGKPIRMIGTTRNISERKQAEQKIREQAALLDITTDAIFVQDLNSHILYWNQGAERVYGWSASEVLGKSNQDLLYPEHSLPLYQTALKTVIATGTWQGEFQKITKSQQEIIVESRWTLVQDASGNPKSILIVNTDITQKKQLEEQFFRTQRLESLGTLAGGIAHDLNNILTPILAAAQLLKNKKQPKTELKLTALTTTSQHLLEIIENNAKRGAALVKQVLSFARGCKGERTIVQLKHLITDIVLIGKQTFPKSIEWTTKLPENLYSVSGDPTQLHQVLMNLVVNARDAMPEGGKITISAENVFLDQAYAQMNINAQVGHYIVIKIQDTGVGMPPKVLDRIFEPFFTTKEIGTGTGLGLSTVLGITKSHGGFLTVTSKIGGGSQFNLFLPAVPTIPDSTTEDHLTPQGNGELILVVDDEVQICEIIKMILEQHNYQVLTAHNGIEAIALYAQNKHKISAIVMDMMMPELDGVTTIRTVQKMNPDVQIIACSGQNSPEAIADIPGMTVHQILPKPFTAAELLKSLHDAVGD